MKPVHFFLFGISGTFTKFFLSECLSWWICLHLFWGTSHENASSQKAFSETISVHCAFVPLTKWSQKCKHLLLVNLRRKNSWIDDACENFSLCKQIHLVLFRYFAVKLRLGGPEGKFAKMYFNLQKDDDLAFSENHLAVANVLKCSQLLVFT